MVKVVGLEMKWAPNILGALFIGGKRGDIHGLEFWYNTIAEKYK